MCQLIHIPTRIAQRSESTIDHIYTNYPASYIKKAGTLKLNLSDHLPVYVLIKKPKTPTTERITFTYRQLKNFEEQDLEEELNLVDWEKYYECTAECWEFLYKIFIDILDRLCLEITLTNVPQKNSWISAEILELGKTTNEAKNEYVNDLLSKHEGNPKKFWDYLKPLVKDDKSNQQENIEIDGSDLAEVPNAFNNYFASLGTQLDKQIKDVTEEEAKLLVVAGHQQASRQVLHGDKTLFKFRKTTLSK